MGWIEWLIILAIAALLFRPRQLGKTVGGMAGSLGAEPPPPESAEVDAARDERTLLLAVLELPPDADARQIRKAWRELAKVWHPDRFTHDPALQERATARLKAINAAYAQLQAGAAS